jgi:hypothetical protein
MATQDSELHGSRQTHAYACLAITFAAATITIILRLIARRLTKVSLWLDDYLAIAAYVFAGAWTGLVVQCMFMYYSNAILEEDADVF